MKFEAITKKRILIMFGVACAIAVIVAFTLCFVMPLMQRDGLYKQHAWGTSFEEMSTLIQKEAGAEYTFIENNMIVRELLPNFEGTEGVSASIEYQCDLDGTLHEVAMILQIDVKSKVSIKELYDKYRRRLSLMYGIAENDTLGEKWDTEKSNIRMTMLSKDSLMIEYIDKIITAREKE